MRFQPIKPKKISAQIADQLRASILHGHFLPGKKLPPERELAEMFGVSRPSVREALHHLECAGLVTSYQGGGTVVRSLMEASESNPLRKLISVQHGRALEVIEVRKCVEAWTSFYAAERALPEDVQLLEEILLNMEHNLEEETPSEDPDAHFHLIIARATGNLVWLHLMQDLFDAMQEFQLSVWRAPLLTREDQEILLEGHRRILNAIRAGDGDGAREAMMEHLTFAEKRSAVPQLFAGAWEERHPCLS